MTVELADDFVITNPTVLNPLPVVSAIYKTLLPNYLVVRDARANAFGLSVAATAGLIDVYWINVFGPPYVKMFGQEKLLELPVFKSVQLEDGGVYVQVTEMPTDPASADGVEGTNRVRQYLGEEFFRPEVAKRGAGQFHGLNVRALIGSLRGAKSSTASSRIEVPEIDWSRMLV